MPEIPADLAAPDASAELPEEGDRQTEIPVAETADLPAEGDLPQPVAGDPDIGRDRERLVSDSAPGS